MGLTDNLPLYIGCIIGICGFTTASALGYDEITLFIGIMLGCFCTAIMLYLDKFLKN